MLLVYIWFISRQSEILSASFIIYQLRQPQSAIKYSIEKIKSSLLNKSFTFGTENHIKQSLIKTNTMQTVTLCLKYRFSIAKVSLLTYTVHPSVMHFHLSLPTHCLSVPKYHPLVLLLCPLVPQYYLLAPICHPLAPQRYPLVPTLRLLISQFYPLVPTLRVSAPKNYR